MKINASGLERYKSYVSAVKKEETQAAKSKGLKTVSSNTDKVEISQDAASRAEVARLASSVALEVEGTASPQRLREITENIENGTYFVSAQDVADAILDRFV